MLSLASSIFSEQRSLERLVSKIIAEATEMLKVERCTVYLLDLRMYEMVSEIMLVKVLNMGPTLEHH